MAATVHKLTAGDGYTYLTRHVAGADVDRARGQSAADYYTAEGNPPGRWIGRGAPLLGIAGQPVTEAQMLALFGHGMHPDADRIIAAHHTEHLRAGMTEQQIQNVARDARRAATLGRPFPLFAALDPYDERVAARLVALSEETGRAPTTAETAVARREEARRQRAAVAGYDVVFAPVKSAAVLWAADDRGWVRDAVRTAHEQARDSALGLLEEHAAFTRVGAASVAQIDTHGLVAAAFDHYDSRDGDPNLHTHVAIANKVQGVDRVWRSLDARALYRMTVAVSEHYNTVFQAALTERLGVTWEPRAGTGQRGGRAKEPVYEIAGVPAEFVAHFSRRRAAIEARYTELVAEYRATHGREPAPAAAHQLARQANLDTRQGKKVPRSLISMRARWRAELAEVFGENALRRLAAAVADPNRTVPDRPVPPVSVDELAARVVAAVGEARSTWTVWNLRAETERLLRVEGLAVAPAAVTALAAAIVERAASPAHSILVEAPTVTDEPASLRRADGESVFAEHAAGRYTSTAVLDAEARLVAAAHTVTDGGLAPSLVAAALAGFDARAAHPLDDEQRALVTAFATDPRRLVVGIGAAGTGKTTATRAYLHVLRTAGRRLVPLATSAASAAVLAAELGIAAENVHKFLHEHHHGPHADRLAAGEPVPASHAIFALRPGDVVLVDEAGMAGTGNLDRILALATRHGATVRLLGDYRQLAAVESGGALRLIAADAGAAELTTLHRFTDPAEATATLALRTGDTSALDFYTARDRIHGGSRDAMTEAAYTAWQSDMTAGRISVMIAATNTDVTALAARARADRVTANLVEPDGVTLVDGNRAGVGDWIVTRHNQRRLSMHGGRDFVRNGDAWTVLRRHRDGSLTVRHHDHHGILRLPAAYVAEHVQLLYAMTAHRAQGSTVDTAHVLADESMAREHLYVALTRARDGSWCYVATHDALPLDEDDRLDQTGYDPHSYAARELLETILAREAAELSATETIRTAQDHAASLATLMPRLTYAARQAADTHYRDLVTATLDAPLASELISGSGWESVVTALHTAEGDGWQPDQVLAAALRAGPLTDADTPARVLAWRISQAAADREPGRWLIRPNASQAARFADLIAEHVGQRPDPADALHPPAALRTQVAAPFVPSAFLSSIVGASAAERQREQKGWPALRSALHRAHRTGHDPASLLRAATAQPADRRLAGDAQALAQHLHQQITHTTTPSVSERQAWTVLAWTLAAHEHHGGDVGDLLAFTPRPSETGQPLDQLRRHIDARALRARQAADDEAPPWTPSDTTTGPDAAHLTGLRAQIAARVTALTDTALRDRPAWTTALGTPPAGAQQRADWRHALAVVAAYRDQHQVTSDDPAHPLGPYPNTGHPAHHAYWQAANAIVSARRTGATGLSLRPREPQPEMADAAHRTAADTYRALSRADRDAIAATMIARLGDLWHGHHDDIDTGVTQPAYAQHLRRALIDEGHLARISSRTGAAPDRSRRQAADSNGARARRAAVSRSATVAPQPTPTPLERPRQQPAHGATPRPRL